MFVVDLLCYLACFFGSEKTQSKKHADKIFTGLPPDLGGGLCLCVFYPIRNDAKKTIWHPPSPGTIPLIYFCLCVVSFPDFLLQEASTSKNQGVSRPPSPGIL